MVRGAIVDRGLAWVRRRSPTRTRRANEMTVRIGINGFGRLGRSYLRAALASAADVEVVAVNDVTDAATLAALLEWDSISGHLDGVAVDGDTILVGEKSVRVLSQRAPAPSAGARSGRTRRSSMLR
jgi:hypothetical protein